MSCLPCTVGSICTIGTKKPLRIQLLNETSKELSDPYFEKQKIQNSDTTPYSVRIGFIIGCAILVLLLFCIGALVSIVVIKYQKLIVAKIGFILKSIDMFSLKHFVAPDMSPVNRFTSLGGFFSIVYACIAFTVMIISIVDVARGGNVTERVTVVPKQVTNVTLVDGNYFIKLVLHNYLDSTCTVNSRVIGLEPNKNGNLTIEALLVDTNSSMCIVLINCTDCHLTGVSQSIALTFDQPLATASVIEYNVALPHYDGPAQSILVNELVKPDDDQATLFRGNSSATIISLSLTTTLLQTIDAVDYFFYSFGAQLFQKKSPFYIGYSPIRNPTTRGSTVTHQNFFNHSSVQVRFEFTVNPNGNFIQQEGKATILDLFSKIFALIGATGSVCVMIMLCIERINMRARNKAAVQKNVQEVLELN